MNTESTLFGKTMSEIRVLVDRAEDLNCMRLVSDVAMLQNEVYKLRGLVANYEHHIKTLSGIRAKHGLGIY
jgi:hypothetical protein